MSEQVGFEIGIIYGQHRLDMAAWCGKHPDDITIEDADRYEAHLAEQKD